MGVTVTNLLMGPCDVFVGAFGATEPTLGTWTAPGVAWVDAGGTTGGVTLKVSMDFKPLEVDQVPDEVGQRMTKRSIMVESTLAEATLENVKSLMNGGTIATGTGYKSFEPLASVAAFQPTYSAILLRGYAPGASSFLRHVIVRKVLSSDGFEFEQAKDKQSGFKVKWSGNYVSSSILPFSIIDQTV
jgi:hypothetical protein